jgi:hypothetical protein
MARLGVSGCGSRGDLGTVGDVLALIVIGVPVLAVLVWGGVRLLWAGRELDEVAPSGSTRAPVAASGSMADKVDRGLIRARAALETLVMPEVEHEELQPSTGAHRHRAQTYLVLGTGLLGLAASLLIGILLVM